MCMLNSLCAASEARGDSGAPLLHVQAAAAERGGIWQLCQPSRLPAVAQSCRGLPSRGSEGAGCCSLGAPQLHYMAHTVWLIALYMHAYVLFLFRALAAATCTPSGCTRHGFWFGARILLITRCPLLPVMQVSDKDCLLALTSARQRTGLDHQTLALSCLFVGVLMANHAHPLACLLCCGSLLADKLFGSKAGP